MGAIQSKKRRKDRKRRRRQHLGGTLSAHFDVPRSVSLDALRTHGVTSPSSAAACCPHCGGWNWAWAHAGGRGSRGTDRRTLSGLLESSGVCHGFHRCLRGQYDAMHSSESHLRGYDSEDHLPCPVCTEYVSSDEATPQPSAHVQTMACPGPEHSTMSLNRNVGRKVHSPISHSASAEFSDLLEILRRHEELQSHHQESPVSSGSSYAQPPGPRLPRPVSSPPGGISSVTPPEQSNRIACSSTAAPNTDLPATTQSTFSSPSLTRVATKTLPAPEDPDSSTPTTGTSKSHTSSSVTPGSCDPDTTDTTATTPKKPISVLEDEETRLARWEKQKLMTEQFRLLRKHLLARDLSQKRKGDATDTSGPLPLSLKGPLDAVESYLSSQSTSKCSENISNRSSLPPSSSPAAGDSQVPGPGNHSQPVSLLSEQKFTETDSGWSESAAERASLSATSSSLNFSSLPLSKTTNDASSPAASDSDNFRSLRQPDRTAAAVPSTQQPQALHSRSKFARSGQNYRYLDNHPVLSRLQNEQNSRLERMERKMRCIRASAEQAAERKKFEQIFPARQDVLVEDEKRRMKEAEETLAKLKEENKRIKQMKKTCTKPQGGEQAAMVTTPAAPSGAEDSRGTDDSGEVIPVCFMQTERADTSESTSVSETGQAREDAADLNGQMMGEKGHDSEKKLHWLKSTFSRIDLGNPLTWLVLPFLLFPLILRLLLSVTLTAKPTSLDPSARGSQDDRDSEEHSDSTRRVSLGLTGLEHAALLGQPSTSAGVKLSCRKCSSKLKVSGKEYPESKTVRST
ncbi:hypothetical protein PoB_003460900 [Plakobranchus ocellatus]|uniref:Uncharacterized protein n=1 Tax=Plakobranchus ocellatus TaxID=259542 RepID=A0AAV4AK45_9GAST|nr:hypothetical protein PoB_003460900 [Plakobranchus ocellatus]